MTTPDFAQYVTAASGLFTDLGILPIILAAGVVALAGILIRKAKAVGR